MRESKKKKKDEIKRFNKLIDKICKGRNEGQLCTREKKK